MSMTSNGLFNAMNRFGFSKEQLLAYSPDYQDRTKVDCYIPTRNDVFRMPIDQLQPVIEHWFRHAPPELAPSPEQVKAVIALLGIRPDKARIRDRIAAMAACAPAS